jgi:ATP-dependent DNA helicase RecQ
MGALVDFVLEQANDFDVSIYELSRTHDLRPLVVSTLLTYLELEDVIEATAPFYNEYQLELLRPAGEIAARFEGERSDFVRNLLNLAVKAKRWHNLDIRAAGEQLPSPRERIVRALTYLEEQGNLRLKAGGLRQGYRTKGRPEDTVRLKQQLLARFEARERQDLERVRSVVQLLEQPGCLTRRLLAYFGEELGCDCGHCSRCAGAKPVKLGQRVKGHPALPDSDALARLRREHCHALGLPRQLARFLCGLTSPRLIQEKLTRHPLFGSLGAVAFRDVMAAIDPKG